MADNGEHEAADKDVKCEIRKYTTCDDSPNKAVRVPHDDPDIERMQPGVATGKYEVMVKEKKGFFASAIPDKQPCCIAVLLCFFNCVIPGLGTLVSAPFSLCEKNKPQKTRIRNFGVNILAGLLQLITTPLMLIGWLWSIMWAIEYLKPLKGEGFEYS